MIHSKVLRLVVIGFVVLMWGLGTQTVPKAFAGGEPSNTDPTAAVIVSDLPYNNTQSGQFAPTGEDTTQVCGLDPNCTNSWLNNDNDPAAATSDNTPPGPSCLAAGEHYSQAVWYQWTATFTGAVTVDTIGSNPRGQGPSVDYGQMQDAYTNDGGTNGNIFGQTVGNWTEVPNSCNHAIVPGQQYSDSRATFAVTSGTTYYLMFATYNPSANATPGPGGNLVVNISPVDLSFNPTLPGGGSTLSATEGQAMPNTLIGSFTDGDGTGNLATDAANYSVDVNWGDGVTTTGVTTTAPQDANLQCDESGGIVTCRIYSTHIYAEENTTAYPLSVKVTDNAAGDNQGVQSGNYASVQVADAALSQVTNANPPAPVVEGVPFTNITVGTFSDAAFTGATTNCDVADYVATINYGDGVTDTVTSVAGATGQIVPSVNGAACNFDVLGSHQYANPIPKGGEAIQVTVTDEGVTADNNDPAGATGGSTVSWTFDPEAQDAPLTTIASPNLGTNCAAPVNPGDCVTEGSPFQNALIATFEDTGGPTTSSCSIIGGASVFTGTISWGDGDSSQLSAGNLSIVPSADGNPCDFDVIGGHTYDHTNQSEPITVTINDVDGQQLVITGNAVVSPDQPLQAVLQNQTITGTEGAALNNVYLGTFHDTDPGCVIDDYAATINWDAAGSGVTSTATPINGGIVPANDGTACDFKVFGNHTYVKAGLYSITVTVFDEVPGIATPLSQLTLLDNATIADAPLSSQGLAVNNHYTVVEGIADNNRVLGTVTDADPNCSPNNLTVTINWGDGTPLDTTTGTLSPHAAPNQCTFDVIGSHAFLEESALEPGGLNPVTVTITDVDPAGITPSATDFVDSVQISDAPLAKVAGNGAACNGGTANCLTETTGVPFSNTILGAFMDTTLPGNCDINDYTVTVNWGDSVANPQGNTSVLNYANGGIVSAPGGGFAGAVGAVAVASVFNGAVNSISVINPGYAYTGAPTITILGGGGSGATAQATVANGEVTGIIVTNGGTGYTSPPVVKIAGAPTTCVFNVIGAYKYTHDGTYTVTMKVQDAGGQSIGNTVFDIVNVADAPLTIGAVSGGFTAIEGAPVGTPASGSNPAAPQLVATFTDADPLCSAASYKVVRIDWGDGTGFDTSTGTIKQLPGTCTFGVYGTHTYAEAGTYNVDVVVQDIQLPNGGSTAQLSTSPGGDTVATVKDAALSQVGSDVALSSVEGQPLSTDPASNPVLATFTDADPNCGPASDPSASDYTATVDWGDGSAPETSGLGNIAIAEVPNNAVTGCPYNFQITGTHTYTEEKLSAARAFGTAAINATGAVTGVTITDPGMNYPTAPTVTFSPPYSGTTATGTATISPSGQVTGVTITKPGSGYTSAPSVSFAYPPSIATATAAVNLSGKVTGLTVTSPGQGYTVAPVVTIATPGGGGTQATATAAINGTGQVTGITVTNPGSGYTSAPVVSIAPPDSAYTVTVKVTDNDGGTQVAPFFSTLTQTASVSVADAQLGLLSDLAQQSCILLTSCNTQANTSSPTVPGGVGPASAFPIATFTDLVKDSTGNLVCDAEASQPGQTETPAAHYATSIDWGDGTPQDTTTGVIVERGNSCVFDVYGTHTYTKPGAYTVLTTITDEGGLAVTTAASSSPLTETAAVINVVVPVNTPHFSHATSSIASSITKLVPGKGTYQIAMTVSQYNNVLNAGTFLGQFTFNDPTLKLNIPACQLNKYAPSCRLSVLSFYTCGTGTCVGPSTAPKVGTIWGTWTVVKTGVTRYFRIDVVDHAPASTDTSKITMGSPTNPAVAVQSSPPSAPTNKVVPSS